MRWDSSGRG